MEILPLPVNVRSLLEPLGVESERVTRVATMSGGLGGGRLYRLWLRDADGAGPERTRVLKYAEPLEGWLGDTSQDIRLREAQLFASGLLADLPRGIATATISVAFRGSHERPDAAALLMRDERRYLLSKPLRAPPGTIPAAAAAVVDRLAQLHARYWNDPRLDGSALGLMSPERALLVTGPAGVTSRLAAGDTLPYLSIAAESWQDFFALAGEAASRRFQAILDEPERVTRAIARLPRTLAHGDVWGPNIGRLPGSHGVPRLLLLDWALALAGPATYDPLWLCSPWPSINPARVLAVYRARLRRALATHGISLDGATWLALADAGYLRTVLTCGETLARMALTPPAGMAREAAMAWLRWWIGRALRAADRLEDLT